MHQICHNETKVSNTSICYPTLAVADAWDRASMASVTVCVYTPKRKMAWAINTKVGTVVVHGTRYTC